ncbi:class I SAM-dependent methyltransferase [Halobacteriales archaeon Cl-PHB]
MGFHTFDADRADKLEDPSRYEYVSVDELLGLIDPASDDVVADLGSGTGFYTDAVAPHVGRLVAIDVQPAMHAHYREKGLPANVAPVSATVDQLPLRDDTLDAAFSTMTFHEFATPEALAEVARVLRPGGRVGFADWSGAGGGRDGPPVTERFDASEAQGLLEEAGFSVQRAADRRETLVVAATR